MKIHRRTTLISFEEPYSLTIDLLNISSIREGYATIEINMKNGITHIIGCNYRQLSANYRQLLAVWISAKSAITGREDD